MRRKVVLAAAVLAAVCVASAGAEQTLVDKVVAVVEDDAILMSDIEQAVKQLLFQQGQTRVTEAERQELERRALEELINNKLVIAQAERLGITVSFSEVEEMVAKAIERNKEMLGGEEAFQRQLKSEGLTLEDLNKLYREQIRNRMLVERVIAREIDRGSIVVAEDDIRRLYEQRKPDLPLRPAVVHLATIFFTFGSSRSANEAAKARIEELSRRAASGEDFGRLAEEYSEDPSADRGGDLGFVKLEDLRDKTFASAAARLGPGEISEPVLTSYGYHLIQVLAADSTSGRVKLRHILIRVTADEEGIQESFARANAVHNRLLAGEPFDSLAVRYSEDEATAPSGGDIGWLKVDELPQFFRDVLAGMSPGDISPVLRESSGFRIVKLLGKEEGRPYRYEEVRDELKRVAEQEKLADSYDDYLQGLREMFYVDVRI